MADTTPTETIENETPEKIEEVEEKEEVVDDVIIEEGHDDDACEGHDHDHDHDHDHAHDGEHDHEHDGDSARKPKQSKAEKKCRKAIQKLGLKPVTGVVKVTVKKSKNILFVITQPDVYKSPASDTYIIFGEAKIDNVNNQQLADTARLFEKKTEGDQKDESDDEPPALIDDGEAEGEIDETGLEAKDIELVMSQTNVTRAQAVAALKKADGDMVEAIMELTM
eukprot:CAMPEP_0174253894 /NCGR_PEP_ID=MMETSP0439-20130205/3264_1 /TAXON_ID=0 /ORGANISM="Stereomyxa ramosa, Strain Chinc5" /LENGTH=222 /DNA_ID=CAMNT_0015335193 /DNA_START=46 /DNA_END=714 /DNA_ORIENTATION=+